MLLRKKKTASGRVALSVVVQRFVEVLVGQLEKFGLEHEPKGRGSKLRSRETGRFAALPEFWRYSYGIKWDDRRSTLAHPIVERGRYYGTLIQSWSFVREDLEVLAEELRANLISQIERFVGYDNPKWWFPLDDGEGYQQVPYERALNERWRSRIEDETGRAVDEDSGEL